MNGSRSKALCVISCVPPTPSGIASSTILGYQAAPCPVDIFADREGAPATLTLPRNIRVREIDELQDHDLAGYRAVIVTLGNSLHHLRTAIRLRRLVDVEVRRLALHVHDVCLLNLARGLANAEGASSFSSWLGQYYGPFAGDDSDERLIEAGILGLRAVVGAVQPDLVIVHSRSARDLVARELPGAKVAIVPHPKAALCLVRTAHPGQSPTIGTFGTPAPEKRTEIVIAAFALLKEQLSDARLIVAGFGAGGYGLGSGAVLPDGVELVHKPTDPELIRLMSSVHFAVQLRRRNLGETSGIVLQLQALGVPYIVSRIGTMAEIEPGLAQFVDPECTAHELADLMLSMWRQGSASVSRKARHDGFAECLLTVV